MELAKNPDDPYLYFQIGQEYYCEDDYENAAAYYGKVLTYDLPPTVEYLRMTVQAYGNCLLALNRIEEFIKATSMSNPHAEGTNTYLSWYYIALIYEKMGELDIARIFIKSAETLNRH